LKIEKRLETMIVARRPKAISNASCLMLSYLVAPGELKLPWKK